MLGLGLAGVALGVCVIVTTEQDPGFWVLAAGNLGHRRQVAAIHGAIDGRPDS